MPDGAAGHAGSNTMADVPQEAIDAGLAAWLQRAARATNRATVTSSGAEYGLVACILAAAAPVIAARAAAAERERCAQLAIKRGEELVGKGCGMEPEALWAFADVLRGQDGGSGD